MTPTNKLRFVERSEIIEQHANGLSIGRTVHVLQQWWIPENADRTSAHYKGEWRDVPIEKETV